MGNCKHCGKEVTLKEGEKNCPSCGNPPYSCWNCKIDITGETSECAVCHFFVCPSCDVCSKDCKIPNLIEETKGFGERKKIEHIYNSIQAPDRLNCPKGVPISYAHGKLRNMALRLKGVCVRNKEDAHAFEERFDKLIEFPVEKKWTISKEKEDGEYGIELREISNLAICMGECKKETIVEKDSEGKIKGKYEMFEKVDGESCTHMNWDKLATKYCHKCKRTFKLEQESCNECVYSEGKDKGLPFNLVVRKSKTHFCSLSRNLFNKVKEDKYGKTC